MKKVIEAAVVLYDGDSEVTVAEVNRTVNILIDLTVDDIITMADRNDASNEVWRRLTELHRIRVCQS